MEEEYILGLDVSTKTIGIALFKSNGELKVLTHVTPKVKPKTYDKIHELFIKVGIFEDEFLQKYKNLNITNIIIEEPLLRSNNVNTVGTLLRFNGMISKACYDVLGVVPSFISSYDARAYGFPELMAKRTTKKNGEKLTEAQINKNKPVLFGAYSFDVDKKEVIWNLVADKEPQIMWLYDKNGKIKKECYDMSDAYVVVLAYMNKNNLW